MKTKRMESCVHDNGTVECTLAEVELPDPGPDDVVVEIEAAPINPSDLGLMFGAADLSTARATEREGQPAVLLDVPDAAMRAMAPRVGHWMAVGNEGSGRVIAAGESEAAQALIGQRVGMFGGEMYAGHRCPMSACAASPSPAAMTRPLPSLPAAIQWPTLGAIARIAASGTSNSTAG